MAVGNHSGASVPRRPQFVAGLPRRGTRQLGDTTGSGRAVRAPHLKDPHLAWEQAGALRLDDDHTWAEVAQAYEPVDPRAVLPIHRRLVEHELVDAGAQHYRLATRRLAKMRTLAAGTDQAEAVDTFIAELRDTHRRRPRLQQEFDRAHLP